MLFATALAFVFAWPIICGLAVIALITLLLWSEHEFISTALLLLLGGAFIYALHETDTAIPWSKIGIAVAVYFVVGVLFTLPKWYFWAQKQGRKFKALRVENDVEAERRIASRIQSYNEGKAREYATAWPHIDKYNDDMKAKAIAAQQKIDEAKPRDYEDIRNDVEHERCTSLIETWNNRHSKGVMKVRQINGAELQVRIQPVHADSRSGSMGTWDVFYDKTALVGYLTAWTLNWPFYLVLLLVEDLLTEIFNWLADHLGKSFSRIATKAFN